MFCCEAERWLKGSASHVVVLYIDLKNEKLLGLVACSLLLHMRIYSSAQEAANMYSMLRFVDPNYPFPKSYVRLLGFFMKLNVSSPDKAPADPPRKRLRSIMLHRASTFSLHDNQSSFLFFRIKNSGNLFTSSAMSDANSVTGFDATMFSMRPHVVVQGEVLVECLARGRVLFSSLLSTSACSEREVLSDFELDWTAEGQKFAKKNISIELAFDDLISQR
ncbi:hypothetical protein GUITHDRAFT_113591 [Guillardia theta CCMP2712]|uniref:C2 tensin-type domain-containing protein n=3 Tax=Guillardia theta TaxID=55529 RepID=L1IWW6_GUITC|nr:hypothetical protein GUITHDRAFT_113591 [Guillardia theta CCMP2712]EKX40354.1 hypothetical protein GUITHDRAFT_113591 [Guillardia theta CCMP2712]|eukprot:XP_005827334.1 hypothetical protein GUITHDRAFT_113591 [Guillardia theta CCMP2712]